MSETWLIGEVDEAGKKLVQTAYECLEKAIASGTAIDRLGDSGADRFSS